MDIDEVVKNIQKEKDPQRVLKIFLALEKDSLLVVHKKCIDKIMWAISELQSPDPSAGWFGGNDESR
jgi:hypothetical protein